jgi:two-component system KDP operon response regulator KdpE
MDLKMITTETTSRVSPVAQSVQKTNAPAKHRILVVDDDPIVLKTTEIKLKEHGFAVTTAIDGPTAIHAARSETPDLILLDLSFPTDVTLTWDGFSIMSWLRRLESTKNVPVIIFTGLQGDSYYQRARTAGVAGFFHKPLNFGPLLSLIDLRLKSKVAAQPVQPAEPPLKLRLAP